MIEDQGHGTHLRRSGGNVGICLETRIIVTGDVPYHIILTGLETGGLCGLIRYDVVFQGLGGRRLVGGPAIVCTALGAVGNIVIKLLQLDVLILLPVRELVRAGADVLLQEAVVVFIAAGSGGGDGRGLCRTGDHGRKQQQGSLCRDLYCLIIYFCEAGISQHRGCCTEAFDPAVHGSHHIVRRHFTAVMELDALPELKR